MSQNYGEPTSGSQAGSGSGTAETAKHEAGEVAGTAKAEAGHVVETAKQEAAGVASEAKSQAKQVYAQTKQQLTEQAASQQQRVADGLRSIGDELDSLAQNSENPGIATDLVRQVSSRVSGADGVEEYTDVDTELFGLSYDEIWIVRAAFALLQDKALAAEWKKADTAARKAAAACFKADASKKAVALK